jgi:urease accessory protein
VSDQLAGQVSLRVRSDQHPLGPVASVFHTGSLAVRITPWGAWLVASAAAPLAGDLQSVEIALEEGADLHVRSASATLARPGPGQPGPSVTDITARVADRAALWWHPEPGVSVEGSDHHTLARVTLAPTARFFWLEELVLGRAQEPPGRYRTTLRVEGSDGHPLLASDLVASSGAPGDPRSPLTLDGARAAAAIVIVDPTAASRFRPATDRDLALGPPTGAAGTALPFAGGGVQVMAWGPSLTVCRQAVTGLAEAAGVPCPHVGQVLGDPLSLVGALEATDAHRDHRRHQAVGELGPVMQGALPPQRNG